MTIFFQPKWCDLLEIHVDLRSDNDVYLYIIGEMSTYKLRNGIFSKFPVFKKNLKRFEQIIMMKSRFIYFVSRVNPRHKIPGGE